MWWWCVNPGGCRVDHPVRLSKPPPPTTKEREKLTSWQEAPRNKDNNTKVGACLSFNSLGGGGGRLGKNPQRPTTMTVGNDKRCPHGRQAEVKKNLKEKEKQLEKSIAMPRVHACLGKIRKVKNQTVTMGVIKSVSCFIEVGRR